MTESTNTLAGKKPKTVAEDMAQRVVFATATEAEQYLTGSAERFSDFGALVEAGKFIAPGMIANEDGSAALDPAVYGGEGIETMVTLLRKKGASGEVKAIVVAPIPSLQALLDNEAGRKFVQAIIYKELNHRAVRVLREAEDVSTVADQIPTTLEAYITSSRDSGGLMEAFNELHKSVNATMSAAVPAWSKRRFTKLELRKSFESKGYALDTYPEIEEAGKNGSLFEKALAVAIASAERKALDSTIFKRWLETRATKTYEADELEDEELDLDALTESLLADDKPAVEQTGEATDDNQPGE